MKRYLVFSYQDYYPSGGSSDVVAEADTLEEVKSLYDLPANSEQRWYGLSEYVDVLDMQEKRWLNETEFQPVLSVPEDNTIQPREIVELSDWEIEKAIERLKQKKFNTPTVVHTAIRRVENTGDPDRLSKSIKYCIAEFAISKEGWLTFIKAYR